MMLHTYNPQPRSLPSINFLHLAVYKMWPRKEFQTHSHYNKVKSPIKVGPWHCTPTAPNQCYYQISTFYTLCLLRYSLDKLFAAPTRPSWHHRWKQYPTALKCCGVKNLVELHSRMHCSPVVVHLSLGSSVFIYSTAYLYPSNNLVLTRIVGLGWNWTQQLDVKHQGGLDQSSPSLDLIKFKN